MDKFDSRSPVPPPGAQLVHTLEYVNDLNVSDVREFSAFCRASGGFRID